MRNHHSRRITPIMIGGNHRQQVFVLHGADDVLEALEEDQMQLQGIAGMGKFVDIFREEVRVLSTRRRHHRPASKGSRSQDRAFPIYICLPRGKKKTQKHIKKHYICPRGGGDRVHFARPFGPASPTTPPLSLFSSTTPSAATRKICWSC